MRRLEDMAEEALLMASLTKAVGLEDLADRYIEAAALAIAGSAGRVVWPEEGKDS